MRGATFDPRSGEMRFRAAAAAWLESRHDLKSGTRAGYTYALAPADQHRGDARELCIDAVLGGYPVNAITRPLISDWIARMVAANKKPSTVKHAYFLVRMVLGQAVADGRVAANPADYVKLPSERGVGSGTPGLVDDPDMFLAPPRAGPGPPRCHALAVQRAGACGRVGRPPGGRAGRPASRRR